MCYFLCRTMLHAKSLLHWSVIHYQVTFEWHFGCDSETSILSMASMFRQPSQVKP